MYSLEVTLINDDYLFTILDCGQWIIISLSWICKIIPLILSICFCSSISQTWERTHKVYSKSNCQLFGRHCKELNIVRCLGCTGRGSIQNKIIKYRTCALYTEQLAALFPTRPRTYYCGGIPVGARGMLGHCAPQNSFLIHFHLSSKSTDCIHLSCQAVNCQRFPSEKIAFWRTA